MAGVAVVGGVGFTVSIFVTGLAFDSPELQGEGKTGVLAASLAAGLGACPNAIDKRLSMRLQ
jgi:NhaA family Na+:H+ antiporter